MKRFKCAAAILLAVVLSIGMLTGCGKSASEKSLRIPDVLSVSLGSAPVTLDPARAEKPEDLTILANLYENLMKLAADEDGNLQVVPAMARSYEESRHVDGSVTYTFRLRSARWSDGSIVTAEDFVYAWRRLADPAIHSPNTQLLSIIKGYDEVQSTGDTSALQISAKNSSTFVVTITGTCEWFLSDVCTSPAASPLRQTVVEKLTDAVTPSDDGDSAVPPPPVAADAWASDPTKLVTNGPYCVGESGSRSMTLVQNERYSDDDSPKTIRIVYANTPEDGWSLYESGAVQFLAELPEAQLQIRAENPDWAPLAMPTTGLLLFNTNHEVLSDPLVRQALQVVIDRAAISDAISAACIPAGGLVSSSVPDPDEDAHTFRQHGGDLVNTSSDVIGTSLSGMLQILDDAGFDIGNPFPAMELLFPAEPRYVAAAKALATSWSVAFHTDIRLRAVTEADLNAALAAGQYTMALTELTAAANDAQNFLQYWVTDHPNNVVCYSNTAFDTLLTVIRSASDNDARRGCLHDAESLLLETNPLAPLYFIGTDYALQENLTGLIRDGRGHFLFAGVRQVLLPEHPTTSGSD